MSPVRRESESRRAVQGEQVATRDGVRLGVVKELHAQAFCVEDGRGRTYWLNRSLLLLHGGEAIVDREADQIRNYKLNEPGHQAAAIPRLDEALDAFESAEARIATRRRMERGR